MSSDDEFLGVHRRSDRVDDGAVGFHEHGHPVGHSFSLRTVEEVEADNARASAPDEVREPEHGLVLGMASGTMREDHGSVVLDFICEDRHIATWGRQVPKWHAIDVSAVAWNYAVTRFGGESSHSVLVRTYFEH